MTYIAAIVAGVLAGIYTTPDVALVMSLVLAAVLVFALHVQWNFNGRSESDTAIVIGQPLIFYVWATYFTSVILTYLLR